MDTKIPASEARTDVNLVELRSDIKVGFADLRSDMKVQLAEFRSDMDAKFSAIQGEFAKRPTTATLIGIVASAAATIIGIILAVIAFGGDRFDAGVGMADVRQAQIARDAAQDQSVREINGKLDQLIAKETAQK